MKKKSITFAPTMITFRIKEYGRTELALLYFPFLSPDSAWRKLRGWINHNTTLSSILASSGYDGHQRTFTPYQVAMITEALGEP